MSSPYFGWVPTVTGNLSFSIIGTGRNPKKFFKTYRSVGDKKFTVAAQSRPTSDRIGFRSGRIKNYVFIYLAVSFLDQRHFHNHGMVFFLPSHEYWRYKYLFENLGRYDTASFSASFESVARALQTNWAKRHIVCVKTTLDRNGQLIIELAENDFWEDEEGTVANQVYYFIRDISHTHQHHEPSSDTILKAYPDEKLRNHGNTNWKRETLYALHKFIIQQKRGKRYEALVRCQGVLAYAKAFSDLHIKKEDDAPIYLEKPLRNSLNASASEAKIHLPKTITDILFAGILPFFSFLIAYLILVGDGNFCNSNWQINILHSLLDWTSRNPIISVSLPFFPCLIIFGSRRVKTRIFPLIRPLQRVLLSFGYFKSIAFVGSLFGIAATVTLLAFITVFP